MNVLLTGGTGLIGGFLAQELLRRGHSVRIFFRRAEVPHHLGPWTHQVAWFRGDLLNIHQVAEAMEGCDTVIHAAGLVTFAPREQAAQWEANVTATQLLVDTAMDLKVRRFAYLSSVGALGLPKQGERLNEESLWDADRAGSAYGKSKHFGEREVWRGIEEGLPALILNPSVVLGPGAEVRSSLRLLNFVRGGGKVFTDGMLNYVDVRDLSQLLITLLARESFGERFLVSAGAISYADFFKKAATLLGQKPPQKKLPLWLLRAVAPLEVWRTRLFGGSPLITPDMVRSLENPMRYDTEKSRSVEAFAYRELDETLAWAIEQQWGTSLA